ncbi:MAG: hypothetical protein ABID61_02530, partial [Candidatus Micrarchaeota archaeon]
MVRCRICDEKFRQINGWHLETHGLTVAEYKTCYPKAKMTSNKTKKKISEGNKGKKRTAEHCKNISKRMTGRKRTAEYCKNMTGRKHTAETKKK